jgi:hypothetical protein
MKLERFSYAPESVLSFYEEGFSAMGAICERTWHDRLQILAEGRAARLWNSDGSLHEIELTFAPADVKEARDAAREVFPGCPLTFKLFETLRPAPLSLEKTLIASLGPGAVPDPVVAERLWRTQHPHTRSWRMVEPFRRDLHFSLFALVRCEIQAIDQHWSLHRLAVSLPGGERDDALARDFSLAQSESVDQQIAWPAADPTSWHRFLLAALDADLEPDLKAITHRQESYLRRELDRIDDYFAHYENELGARGKRTASESVKMKTAERLAAACAEHARRRADQVARHEIRVHPHFDSLLLLGELAWRSRVKVEIDHQGQERDALFVPRLRRWLKTEKDSQE